MTEHEGEMKPMTSDERIARLERRFENHAKQLATHLDILGAQQKLLDKLQGALDGQQRMFEALKRAVDERTGPPEPEPPDQVH